MNTEKVSINAFVLAIIAVATICTGTLAGPLSPPPGPVESTGRFGPRIEVNQDNTPGDADSLFKITDPGSYYLARNVVGEAGKHGIEIAASGVTLDLMGFELRGVPNTASGVFIGDAVVNIKIHNGSIRDWGNPGVDAFFASNSILHDLRSQNNGSTGLSIGTGSVVDSCVAQSNAGSGITASGGSTITGCAAQLNDFSGIGAGSGSIITACAARSNGANGIGTDIGSTITACTAHTNTGHGIVSSAASTIAGCSVNFNLGDGIRVPGNCLILGNNCRVNGGGGDGAGIHITGFDGSRIEGNNVSDNLRGIDVDSDGHFIIRNSASGNSVNYDIAPNNSVGDILNVAASTITSSNPWANFSY